MNVIELLKRYESRNFDELKELLKISSEELSNEIRDLEKDNLIVKIKRDYFLIDDANIVFGKIALNKALNGFLRHPDGDIYIDNRNLFGANNEDEVIVKIIKPKTKDELASAEVVKICKRGLKFLVCQMQSKRTKNFSYFKAVDQKRFEGTIMVANSKLKGSVVGNICLLDLVIRQNEAEGKVVEILGHVNDPGSDILALVLDAKVNSKFPEDVLEEIVNVEEEVNLKDYKDRTDLTNELIITIDGDDAKDLDDAVFLKKTDGYYELGVFIADVSTYVRENTRLNDEAYKRGTSIYLADRVIPMLPHKLSNGICSLNPNVNRLSLGVIMKINKYGDVISHEIHKAVIKSKYRMTYNNVNKIVVDKNAECINEYKEIYPMLTDMVELSDILRAKREKRGAIEFEVPEAKIICDATGKAVDIVKRTRGKAEMLIEDFMLAANECIAEHLAKLNYPCVYRIHDKPDSRKMDQISTFFQNNGVTNFSKNHLANPKTIQMVLNQIKDDTAYYTFNNVLLRGMSKAKYSENNKGHFGLAASYYCHFTSPIRRYPDLMVHRIIHELCFDNKDINNKKEHFNSIIPDIAYNNSISERKAIELERNVNDMKAAEYMSNYIGKEFEGIVSSITSFGMFVMLDNTIEGLVHLTTLKGFYTFYPDIPALISRNKNEYKIGTKVKIRVVSSSKENRKIDFEIIDERNSHENSKPKQKSKF